MSRIVLFDGPNHQDLLPLTFTRPVCHLRIGILTILEKWRAHSSVEVLVHTVPHLQGRYGDEIPADPCLFVDGSVIPTATFIHRLHDLDDQVCITSAGQVIAFKGTLEQLTPGGLEGYRKEEVDAGLIVEIAHPADIFALNGLAIEKDLQHFQHLDGELDDTNTLYGDELYTEEGAEIRSSIINTETGPVYIGKNAKVMEGCMIRGPFALCAGATLKMGTKIYGPVTVGPYSKVGGEVSTSVIQGYSNKSHDGFLGNSVLGEWCNLGADTNTSNLKNNYGQVKVWNYREKAFRDSGKMFHGLIMGDHSKCSINTMFNTGTVVGVSANIFGSEFPDKFIPSFSWGNDGEYQLDKALEVAAAVMQRRDLTLGPDDERILKAVFKETMEYRSK